MERQLGLALRALAAIAIIAVAGCGRTSLGARRSSGTTDARFEGDTTGESASSGAAAFAAFAHALGTAYQCFRPGMTDQEAWANQFEDTDPACVAGLLQESEELAQCTIRGSAEVEACVERSGCARTASCDTALLFEDTPLVELVERYCPEAVWQAYWESLKAAHFCSR